MEISPVVSALKLTNSSAPSPQAKGDDLHARPAPLKDAATNPGEIRTEVLPNGVRLVINERPGAAATKFQVGIGSGSLQDPDGKLGLAHMLEHLSFEGSPTKSAAQQEKMRASFGNNWNAWTNQSEVVFWGIIPSKDAKKGAELVTDMFKNPATTGPRVPQERAAVDNEMIYRGGSLAEQKDHIETRLLFGDDASTNNVIGTRASTGKITSKDLQAYHAKNFVGRNTIALVDGDPKSLNLDVIRKQLGTLEPGARTDNSNVVSKLVPGRALQVVNDPTSGTVDLSVNIPIAANALYGTSAATASLLQSSISKRLNDTMRRNHHMTYGASAKIIPPDSTGTMRDYAVLQLKTNVSSNYSQEALEDMVSILKGAHDGFGPKTFDADKTELRQKLKTMDPRPAPTSSDVADAIFTQALYTNGLTPITAKDLTSPSPAQLSENVNKVTREEYVKAMSNLIKLDDMKVLAMGNLKDGGARLLDGIKDAGIDPSSVKMNPVDMKYYTDMGVSVPRNTTPPVKKLAD